MGLKPREQTWGVAAGARRGGSCKRASELSKSTPEQEAGALLLARNCFRLSAPSPSRTRAREGSDEREGGKWEEERRGERACSPAAAGGSAGARRGDRGANRLHLAAAGSDAAAAARIEPAAAAADGGTLLGLRGRGNLPCAFRRLPSGRPKIAAFRRSLAALPSDEQIRFVFSGT